MFYTNHATLNTNIFGYIDDFYTENESLRISGWFIPTIDKKDVEFFLEIDNKLLAIFCYNERLDVAKSYNSKDNKFVKSGFDVSIPVPKSQVVKIKAKVFNSITDVVILDINKNYCRLVQDSSIQEYEEIKINKNLKPELIVVDNFYEDPDLVRRVALEQTYETNFDSYKGNRTSKKFLPRGLKQTFEGLIGRRITVWEEFNYNGIFQYCTAQVPLVYHTDPQSYAGIVFLTPDAPPQTGTSFFRSKSHKVRKVKPTDSLANEIFNNEFYDKTRFELIDSVGNIYNRLVLWDSNIIHAASEYFGSNINNSRLFHLFFFDAE